MKGIILAGGTGSRLLPATRGVNKHLIPIYNKPMIYYPLSILLLMKIRDIILVVNPGDIKSFQNLLRDGTEIGINISYAIQSNPNGLAGALMSARDLADGDNICLVLGDNILYGHDLVKPLINAGKCIKDFGGAYLFAYHVPDPQRFGVIETKGNRVISIEEKPDNPKSNWAVIGLYIYDDTVFNRIESIEPSERGELEITSLNQSYLADKQIRVEFLGRGFAWFDVGTHDSFLEGSEFVATVEKRTGLMIGCIEEIVYRNGWIDREHLLAIAERLNKTEYGKYLQSIAEGKDAF